MTIGIKERISNDIKDAMRAKEKAKLDTLRLVAAAIKQVEVDERIVVDDVRMLSILEKLSKQRKESIAQFSTAGREDLVSKEQFELDLISHYLPPPLSDADIQALIDNAFLETQAEKMSDMGKVMAWLKPLLQGRADMATVSVLIKAKLN